MHPSGICPGSAARPASRADAKFSPLVSPIDETSASQIVESDAAIIDAAVKHAYGAYMKHLDATVAKRLEWLNAAADAIDKIEAELVRSLIRDIGKPRRAATFEAKRAGAFIRACAAQLPHINGEVLPLDTAPTGAGRFGFTTRIPYGVVAAITPFNGPVNLLVQKIAPAHRGRQCGGGEAVAARHRGGAADRRRGEEGGRAGRAVQCGAGRAADRAASGRASAGRRRHRDRLDRHGQRACPRRRRQEIRRRARLQRRQHRLRRRRSRGRRDPHRRRRLRGERAAVHLGAARDRRARGVREIPRAVRRRRQQAQGRRSRRRRDRRRPDGEPRGRRPRRGDGGGRGRQGREARAQARAQGLHPRPGDRRGRAAGGAADGRGGVRPGGGGAAGRQCRRRDRARQFVGVRPAGRLLHQEPRDRVQGVAPAARRLAVDQRRQPLPPRHVSVRRRRLVGLRPRGRALRHGGIVAVEVHRDAASYL